METLVSQDLDLDSGCYERHVSRGWEIVTSCFSKSAPPPPPTHTHTHTHTHARACVCVCVCVWWWWGWGGGVYGAWAITGHYVYIKTPHCYYQRKKISTSLQVLSNVMSYLCIGFVKRKKELWVMIRTTTKRMETVFTFFNFTESVRIFFLKCKYNPWITSGCCLGTNLNELNSNNHFKGDINLNENLWLNLINSQLTTRNLFRHTSCFKSLN